ncbi:MAG: YlqD family protein [Candidatus Zipacnadales bacterium]
MRPWEITQQGHYIVPDGGKTDLRAGRQEAEPRMASVTIRRNVLLKAIVTDQLKKEVEEELQRAADRVAQRIEELDIAGRRYISDLQRIDLQRAMGLRQQVEAEKQRQAELRERLLQRREEVGKWQNGEEVVRGTIEGYVEVKEGDNLAVLLGGTVIVVEDDVVKAIRELSPDELSTTVEEALAEVDETNEGILGTI